MTLVSEVVEVPNAIHKGDFVLDLAQGVDDVEKTLRNYVVTPELAQRFDEALSLIKSALDDRSSKAAYLNGSFGSGKSHFMAVLHALLHNHPKVRAVDDLATVVQKYDALISTKRFLLVPYHLVGKESVEDGVLGGYLAHVRTLHPEAPLPAVLIDTPLLDSARELRGRLGDEAFFALLGNKAADEGWGEVAAGWDATRFEAALNAAPDHPDRAELVTAIQEVLPGFAELARGARSAYINIDDGLAAISQHAAQLGYDGLVLFLDELILWFATRMGDHTWVAREAPKVGKLVEAANANRPAPIISFIARQRDLRELVGTNLPGTEHLAFADSLKWWEGRFGTVSLSDNNLPLIASRRVLRPRDDAARAQIDTAFAATEQVRQDIRSALMAGKAGRDEFRLTYPFSPAFVETLIALSGALQRERTALRVMQQILVEQRDTLQLGQLVPIADLFDVLVAGDDPLTGELGNLWRSAQKVYGDLRRLILELHGLSEEDVAQQPESHAAHRDDKIAKTLVLAALMPEVESLRDLTARRIVALNHGHIRSMVPGQEAGIVLQSVRQWAARLGTVQLTGDAANPLISVRLEGVDIEGVLDNAKTADSAGARRQVIRTLLFEMLGARDNVGLDGVTTYVTTWRGTKRTVELLYGNVRDPSDLGDSAFWPSHDGWRTIFDYPFDEEGHSPVEDLERIRALRDQRPGHTICWVPRHLTSRTVADLGRYVRLQYALGPSFDQLAGHLSDNDRAIARQQMVAQRDQLRSRLENALLQAYGLGNADEALVDTAHGGIDMFASLEPSFTPKVPAGASLQQAFENLLDQMLGSDFPAHPMFGTTDVRATDLRKVHAQVRRAIEDAGQRIMVESAERGAMSRIAGPLRLGEQHAQHFVLGHHWDQHLQRKIAEAGLAGKPVTVGQLRAWLDEPKKMGLPQEIADLVVLLFAEQTNRSIIVHQRPVDVGNLQALPADATAIEQLLPSEEAWKEARQRAQAIFGIGDVTELLTARNVSVLADRVRSKVTASKSAAEQYVGVLAERGPVLLRGEDATSTERYQIADGAARLCEEIAGTGGDVAVVERLASVSLPGAALHVGMSVAAAADLVSAVRRVDWNILATVASWGPDHQLGLRAGEIIDVLAEVWKANEFAKHLQPALGAADTAARQLVLEATRKPDVPTITRTVGTTDAPPAGGATRIEPRVPPQPAAGTQVSGDVMASDTATIQRVSATIEALVREGKRVHVTWEVTE
ncbi:DUF6079 family protein [Actinopolymorpha pittospori]|uniref:Phage resistance protein n=1 Tax=Actinopolymorpha pittospori TaxID=648752 RepID=A0A927MN25_9ACTN|nr:DUF6079 family protein [Actinopolymorpha pittospori]MBE1603711.1 hypothetical protein [Actinopolymorpha pittospori]